jgi:AraC-like DNA-binding protein
MTRPKTTPPRGVLRNAADPERGRLARYHPSPDLELFVEHYWVVNWDLRGQAAERVETLPHPSVHLIFQRGMGGQVAGVSQGKFSCLLEGEGGVLGIKFTPGGFYPFIGVPVSTLSDSILDIAEVFGAEGRAVEKAVLAERDDAPRLMIIEEFLRRCRPELDPQVARIAKIVYSVAEDRTILKVEDLVERYGMNKRTLQRMFAKYVGVSPKWVIQRYRLHEAAEQLAAGPVNQSALALSVGYSDQAHFIRDFKRVVGTSPAVYARAVQPART